MKTMILIGLVPVFSMAAVQFEKQVVCEGEVVHSAQAHDYNGDGLKDLIYTAGGGANLALAPDFKPRQICATPEPLKPNSFHSNIMDVDGDGDMDFIAENQGVYWLECPEDPATSAWPLHWITKDFTGTHCITIHDVDEDGRRDIVVNNFHDWNRKTAPADFSSSILWYRIPAKPENTAAWVPHFLAERDAVGGTHYVAFADVDGDGHDEALHGAKGKPYRWGNYFSYWTRGSDVNEPWKRKKLWGRYKGATHIYGAELTGDGQMDLVGSLGHGKGIVLFTGPKFRARKIDKQLEAPHAFRVADIDKDGDSDLFCCAKLSKKVQWFENDGKGNFTRHALSDNQQAYDLIVCDLDSNGKSDLVIAGHESRNIVLFRQQ